jgi:hypothetical protein
MVITAVIITRQHIPDGIPRKRFKKAIELSSYDHMAFVSKDCSVAVNGDSGLREAHIDPVASMVLRGDRTVIILVHDLRRLAPIDLTAQ